MIWEINRITPILLIVEHTETFFFIRIELRYATCAVHSIEVYDSTFTVTIFFKIVLKFSTVSVRKYF